jgi:hypothetical protein
MNFLFRWCFGARIPCAKQKHSEISCHEYPGTYNVSWADTILWKLRKITANISFRNLDTCAYCEEDFPEIIAQSVEIFIYIF